MIPVFPTRLTLASLAVATLALPRPAAAQGLDVDALRELLRISARATHLGDAFQSLSLINAAPGITAAHFSVDDPSDHYGDYSLDVLKLPLRREFDAAVWGRPLFTELTLGWTRADQTLGLAINSPDVTEADVRIDTLTALAGVGISFPVSENWVIRPIVNLGYSRITDDATTRGPDAALLEEAAQGILFDVSIDSLLYGAALELEYADSFSNDVNLDARIRYQHLWDDVQSASDPALESSQDFGVFTARAEADGPTAARAFGRELRWIGFSSLTWLPGEQTDDLGFDWFAELGGGIELVDREAVRGVEGLSLRGSLLAGNNVTGWTLGLSLEF
jgi:hypothetical protein